MKKIFKVLTSCLVLLLILNIKVKAYDSGFVINDFQIDIIVNENGQFDITESLKVHFTNPYKHGIFFSLPLKYRMEMDGEIKEYHFPMYNYKVTKGKLADTKQNGKEIVLVLGDKNHYANEYEEYQIKYKVKTTKISTADLSDLFYWNLIYRWEAPIESFKFNIDFPKSIDEKKLHFYSGQLKDKEAVNYQITKSEIFKNGVKISGKANGVIDPTQSVTVHLNLGKDYFKYPDYNNGYLIMIGFSSIVCIIAAFLFFKYGKDPLVIKTVEFKAPDGLNSAECGYILKESPTKEHILSLIYYLASKKYLSIKEDEDGKIMLTKLKEADGNLKTEEKLIFDGLFKTQDDEYYFDKVSGNFYDKYIKAFAVIENKMRKKLYDQKNNLYLFAAISLILIFHSLFFIFGGYYFTNRFLNFDIFVLLFPSLAYDVAYIFMFLIYLKNKNKAIFLLIIIWTIIPVLLILSLNNFTITNRFTIYLLIEFVIVVISLIFGCLITKRTDYGANIKGKILGLRDFIKYAEEDRLRALVKDYPQLFYDILPYAFAFELSNLWINHFNNLTLPANEGYHFLGGDRDNLYYSFNRMTNGLNNGIARSFLKNEGRNSFSNRSGGGGGFSSGGGGGFSGGGFGGSSGGSW